MRLNTSANTSLKFNQNSLRKEIYHPLTVERQERYRYPKASLWKYFCYRKLPKVSPSRTTHLSLSLFKGLRYQKMNYGIIDSEGRLHRAGFRFCCGTAPALSETGGTIPPVMPGAESEPLRGMLQLCDGPYVRETGRFGERLRSTQNWTELKQHCFTYTL